MIVKKVILVLLIPGILNAVDGGGTESEPSIFLRQKFARNMPRKNMNSVPPRSPRSPLGKTKAYRSLKLEEDTQSLWDSANKAYEEKKYKKAAKYLKFAAKKGMMEAQFYLGVFYDDGVWVGQSNKKAAKWFLQAAKNGCPQAAYNLGMMYKNGQGIEKSYTNAIRYYQQAANAGLVEAQYALGEMYLLGEEQYPKVALIWLQKAINGGSLEAECNLTVFLYNKMIEIEDKIDFVSVFEKLSEKGVAEATHNLGFFYLNGFEVPRNKARALYYFEKAAAQGSGAARECLEMFNANQDVDQS